MVDIQYINKYMNLIQKQLCVSWNRVLNTLHYFF